MDVYCSKCGKLVGVIIPGSKIRTGTIYTCRECRTYTPKPASNDSEIVDFLKGIFDKK